MIIGYGLELAQTEEAKKVLFLEVCAEIRRRKLEKSWVYEPLHETVERFHASQKQKRIILGGNRSGKSRSAVAEVAMIARGTHPTSKIKTPAKIWIVGKDRVNYIDPILIPMLEEMIPAREIKSFVKRPSSYMKLHNGSEIQLKTMDAGPDAFMSKDLDVLWMDEEPPKEIWDRAKARLADRNGVVILSMTPENGISWVYDEFYQPWKAGAQDIEVFEYDTRWNKYIDPKGLQQMISDCKTPEEFAMRILGKFVAFGAKRLFPEWVQEEARKGLRKPIWRGEFYSEPNGEVRKFDDDRGPFQIWEGPNKREQYVIGVDASEGIKDNTEICVLKIGRDGLEQVAEYNACMPVEYIDSKVYEIARFYNNALVNIERNGGGLAVITALMKRYNNLYLREKERGFQTIVDSTQIGWHTGPYAKLRMVGDTRLLFKEKRLIIRSEAMQAELDAYVEDKRGAYTAQHGHDDRVIGLMLAVQAFLSQQVHLGENEPEGQDYAIQETGDSLFSY